MEKMKKRTVAIVVLTTLLAIIATLSMFLMARFAVPAEQIEFNVYYKYTVEEGSEFGTIIPITVENEAEISEENKPCFKLTFKTTTESYGDNSVRLTDFKRWQRNDTGDIRITMPATVEYNGTLYTIKEISESAFAASDLLNTSGQIFVKSDSILSGIDLSETQIEKIADGAFFQNSHLEFLKLPRTIVEIGKKAFEQTHITTLLMPDSLVRVGDDAFASSDLVVVRTGKNLQYVGNGAFSKCDDLTYFQIGFNPVDWWGNNVFGNSLKINAFIPTTLAHSWNKYAGLSANGQWVASAQEATWKIQISDIRVLEYTQSIGDSSSIEASDEFGITYTITGGSATVNGIKGNDGIKELYIPAKVVYDQLECDVTAISVFEGYEFSKVSIEKIVLSDTEHRVTIAPNAFSDCSALTEVIIGKNVNSFEASVFSGCSNLKRMFFMSGKDITKETFGDFVSGMKDIASDIDIVIPRENNGTQIGSEISAYHILDENSVDGQGIFYCTETDSETATDASRMHNFAYVGDAMHWNSNDESANTSRYSGSDFMSGQSGQAVIPEYVFFNGEFYMVTRIGRYAFYNSSSLITLKLGDYVEVIFDCSLRNARSLNDFIVSDKNVKFATDVNNQILLGTKMVGEQQRQYTKIVKAGVNVVSYLPNDNEGGTVSAGNSGAISAIEDYAFANCTKLSKFDFSQFAGLAYVGAHAFENTALTEVDLSTDTEKYIAREAFSNCYLLQKVTIGPNVHFYGKLDRNNNDDHLVNGVEKDVQDSDNNLHRNFDESSTSVYRFPFLHCNAIKEFVSSSTKYIVGTDGALYYSATGYLVLLQYPAAKEYLTDTDKADQININELSQYVCGGETVPFGSSVPVKAINAYAFAYASYLTSVTVGDNVVAIGKAAFENCVRLEQIYIGTSVVYIGMEIPANTAVENTIYVSGERYDKKDGNEGIKNIYPQEVFQNCYVLSSINVAATNRYYTSDTNGVLYNKDKTTLYIYAQGISRRTFTLPVTVETIDLEAFQYNTHIERVNIPETTKTIGAKAFNGCTMLNMIYFRTIVAPKIGDQTFNSTGALNNGLTVYSIPEPGVWLDARAEMWEGYKVEKYNSIEEIPNATQPTDDVYLVYVVDADGNSLTGMEVSYKYTTANKVATELKCITNTDGYAVFTVPFDLNPAILDRLDIHDPAKVFYDYHIENFQLDFEIGYSYITLYAVPSVSGVSMSATNKKGAPIYYAHNGNVRQYELKAYFDENNIRSEVLYSQSIEAKTATLNTAYLMQTSYWFDPDGELNYGEGNERTQRYIAIRLHGAWDAQSQFKAISLYSDDAYTKEIVIAAILKSADEHDITLIIDPNEIDKSACSCPYVKLNIDIKDENGGQIIGSQEARSRLNINFYHEFFEPTKFPLVNEFAFGDSNITIDFPSNIPLLGGIKLGVDDGALSKYFYTKITADKTVIGFTSGDIFLVGKDPNMTVLKLIDKNTGNKTSIQFNRDKSFNNPFEELDSVINDIVSGKSVNGDLISDKTSHKLSFKIGGTWEMQYGANGSWFITKNTVYGSLKYEFKCNQTTVVWFIPVTMEIKFTAEGKIEFFMTYDYEAELGQKLSAGKDFGLKIDVDVSAGIGVSALSVGIYGSAGIDLLFRLRPSLYLISAKLSADFGLYFKLDLGLIKFSKKWSLFGGGVTQQLYPQQKSRISMCYDADGRAAYSVEGDNGEKMSFLSMNDAVNYALAEASDTGTFQPCDYTDYSLYGGADPQIVSDGKKTYKFYIENVLLNKSSSVQGTYNEYNYLKLVYRTLQSNGSWSDYTIVDDNGLNDTGFDVAAHEGNIYVALRSAGSVITDESTAKAYKSNVVLNMYCINSQEGVSKPQAVSANFGHYIYKFDVAVVNDTPYVVWVGNEEDNLFGLSGNGNELILDNDNININNEPVTFDRTDKNVIAAYKFNGRQWENVWQIRGLETVVDATVTLFGEKAVAAIVTDTDCNLATEGSYIGDTNEEDRRISFIEIEGSVGASLNLDRRDAYIQITNEDGKEELIALGGYAKFIYAGNRTYLAANDSIYTLELSIVDGQNKIVAKCIVSGVSGTYELICDGDGNLYGIAAIIFEDSKQSGLYFAVYENGEFGEFIDFSDQLPVGASGKNRMVESLDVYFVGGTAKVIGTYSDNPSDSENSSDDNSAAKYGNYEITLTKADDIALTSVAMDDYEIEYGTRAENNIGEITFTVNLVLTVKNNSLKSVNGFTAELFNGNGDKLGLYRVNETLKSGAVGQFNVTYKLVGNDELFNTEFSIKIVADKDSGISEVNTGNNECEVSDFAKPDIAVSTKFTTVSGIKYLLVMVQNKGVNSISNGVVYVKNGVIDCINAQENGLTTMQDNPLYSLEFTDLKPGEYKYFNIELNRVYFTDQFVTVAAYVMDGDKLIGEYTMADNGVNVAIDPNEAVQFNVYTVRYFINGEECAQLNQSYMAGQKVEIRTPEERQGYTFSGWTGEVDTMPAHDVFVFGYYTINTYVVKYYVDYVDGGTEPMYTDEYRYGTEATLRDDLVREGYTFSGWFNDEGLTEPASTNMTVTQNVSLYGAFTRNSYTLTYYVDGEAVESYKCEYGQAIETFSYTSREGYEFNGWSDIPVTMPAYDVAVYGTTSICYYTVEYRNDGELVHSATVRYSDLVSVYNYELTGYNVKWVYSGNSDDGNNGRKFTAKESFTMPASNVTLTLEKSIKTFVLSYYVNSALVKQMSYAYGATIENFVYSNDGVLVTHWNNMEATMPAYDLSVYAVEQAMAYEIEYILDDEPYGKQYFEFGTEIDFKQPAPRTGYTFGGWTFTKEDGTLLSELVTMPTHKVIARGKYTVNKYAVNWIVDGTIVHSDESSFGSRIEQYDYNVADGYSLSEWSSYPERVPAENVNIFATTAPINYSLTYYIGNSPVKTETIPFGTAIIAYEYNPEQGYTFNGWRETVPETMPAHNLRIYGSVSPNEYAISYYIDGNKIGEVKYRYGEKVVPYDYDAPEGYSFSGFENEPETMPSHNFAVYGGQLLKVYKVYYYVDGELVYTDEYTFGKAIDVRREPVKEGYTFSGWGEVDENMPAKDIVLNAAFTVNTYTVNYYIDGVLTYTDKCSFGEQINLRSTDERKVGYTFGGWDLQNLTMPAKNVSVYGVFNVNRYKCTYMVGKDVYLVQEYSYGDVIDLPSFEHSNVSITGWNYNGQEIGEMTMPDKDIVVNAIVNDTNIAFIVTLAVGVTLVAGSIAAVSVLSLKLYKKKRQEGGDSI